MARVAAVAGERAGNGDPMSAPVETYRGAVYPWHCDHMGHMNVMWYVGKFDEATWHLFRMVGLSSAWLKANGRGMATVEFDAAAVAPAAIVAAIEAVGFEATAR